MGKLKKKLWISVLLIAIIVGGFYFLVKGNPPLDMGTLASSEDHKSVVVGMGNKGFREVKIIDVSVNNDEKPSETKVQVSNALQGFIITDDYDNPGSKPYGFQNIEDIAIKAGTSPSAYFKKMDEGTATKNDEIYGLSLIHHEAINRVNIRYSYLGITFDERVFFEAGINR
ncbi:hypothetical protein BP422_02955 [Brevibacillus formosus]|uniref:Uncharacterized protein n=1 Tax=Brevibacillus formosus TaxID=54913 RepID=A0A220MC89_9BACL|nr:hypothetical protein [Brevibacillus formosus]ASJ52598.1 hypothetical protein BP422_02955 [Brevibacillus formosus]